MARSIEGRVEEEGAKQGMNKARTRDEHGINKD
jgi:hypothetical protein